MTLQHIQGNLDSINYDAKVGIITFNTSVTYYSIPEDLSEENIKRVSCIDTENPFCALSEGDLYLSLAEEREKIDFLINHLIQQAEKMSSAKAQPTNMEIVIESILQSMQYSGGKAIIMGISQPQDPKCMTKVTENDDGKQTKVNKYLVGVKLLLTKNPYFEEKALELRAARIGIDQFWFNRVMDTTPLAYLSQKTGGKFTFYPNFSQFLHSTQLYYQLYSTMAQFSAMEVVARLRSSEEIKLISFNTPAGQDPLLDISLSTLNTEQMLVANLEASNLKAKPVHFQLVLIHSDFFGQRKLRVINLCLPTTTNLDLFYRSLNCEALVYTILRTVGDSIKTLDREAMRVKALSMASDVVREYIKFVKDPLFR